MDEFLLGRLADLARGATHAHNTRFSRFLDPGERVCAERAARDARTHLQFFGGYSDAERVIAAFYTQDPPAPADYPIACLAATWDARYGAVSHRDLLGAQMALGMDRACLGDIAISDARAYLFMHTDATRYVEQNLESAGRVRLKLERVDAPDALNEPQGRTLRVTVTSMRLDAVLAGAYNVSRAEAQRLIARELVKLNHVIQAKSDARVQTGDLISARGMGRVKLLDAPAETKKGRLALNLFVYGK